MARDRSLGIILLVGGILGILLYGRLLFSRFDILILKLTALIAVASIFGILAWIGYTMATTPPITPVETEAASLGTAFGTSERKQESR